MRIGRPRRSQSSFGNGLARTIRRRFLRTATSVSSVLTLGAIASGPAARIASAAFVPTIDARYDLETGQVEIIA